MMKKKWVFLLIVILAVSCSAPDYEISLSGEWRIEPDSALSKFCGEETEEPVRTIILPGTLDEAEIGHPSPVDSSLCREVMLTLSRKFNYTGPVYYTREINIPDQWKGKEIILEMERILWKSEVWVDDQYAGSRNSLTTPHMYNLTQSLQPGRHKLRIAIDNSRQTEINSDDLAHAYTDHTQIKWNGILGRFRLIARPVRHITELSIYPDFSRGEVSGNIQLEGNIIQESTLKIWVKDSSGRVIGEMKRDFKGNASGFLLKMEEEITGWCERTPELYTLCAELIDEGNKLLDIREERFGFRDIETDKGSILLNGEKIFLRGSLECCIFPLTGHPPMDTESWKSLMLKAREYGLNHLRFHSWCPPDAAFEAADELGFYLQAELPNWSLNIGENEDLTVFLTHEAENILRKYGNHPSFIMFSMGNELMGDFRLINGWVKELKAADPRRLYTATSFTFQEGHTGKHEPYDDFYITQWTDSGWVRGQSVFENFSPSFNLDYRKAINHISVPVISHEIGQYSVFPDMKEIDKYTGVLEPLNFKAVRNNLRQKNLLQCADDYTHSTGRFATVLYKEEIERAFKTSGISGFQLLDIHDFPGQGTALVGILDAFWDSKGFTSGEEFRQFCAPLVPLLWFDQAVYSKKGTFNAEAGLSNYLDDLSDICLEYSVMDEKGNSLFNGNFLKDSIPNGSVEKLGAIRFDFKNVETPAALTVALKLKNTPYKNSWKIWVYDNQPEIFDGAVKITSSFEEAVRLLGDGEKVLLSPPLNALEGIQGKFLPVFWSPVHFPNQPGTMGILCAPDHPVFSLFPTESHSNWQWWDISRFSKTIEIEGFKVNPLVTVIDNFFKNRKLSNLFEAKCGAGSLVFSSIDLMNSLENRPSSLQLKKSILNYMNSDAFDPQQEITKNELLRFYTPSATEESDPLSVYH